MYLLILVGVLAVVAAFRPAGRGPRWVGFVRFAVVAVAGAAVVVTSFEAAGRIDALRVAGGRIHVLERFPARLLGASVWTTLDVHTGRILTGRSPPDPGAAKVAASKTSTTALRVPRTLRGRIERPIGGGEGAVEVGPELLRPVAAATSDAHAVVSAFDRVYDPATVYLARYRRDGTLDWRLEARALGLSAGRLRRAAAIGEGDLVLAFEGFAADRSWFERLTLDSHVVVVRVDAQRGAVRWTSRF
jgi:hypothetical protein